MGEVLPIHPQAKVFTFPVQFPTFFLSCFLPSVPFGCQVHLAIISFEQERESFRFEKEYDFCPDFCVPSKFRSLPRIDGLELGSRYSCSLNQSHGQTGIIPVFRQEDYAQSILSSPNLSSSFVHR
jgi:hypothetical protein